MNISGGGESGEKITGGNDHGVCSRVVFQLAVYQNPDVFHAGKRLHAPN